MKREPKSWLESKFLMLAVLTIASAGIDAVASGLGWRQVVIAIIGALIVVLRAYTDGPVEGLLPKKKRPPLPPVPPILLLVLLFAGTPSLAHAQMAADPAAAVELEPCPVERPDPVKLAIEVVTNPVLVGFVKDTVKEESRMGNWVWVVLGTGVVMFAAGYTAGQVMP